MASHYNVVPGIDTLSLFADDATKFIAEKYLLEIEETGKYYQYKSQV